MSPAMRLGVLADTHGLFDRAILRHFLGVDHILHAGDVGGRAVLAELEKLAPVTAVSGNVDGYERSGLARTTVVSFAGHRIALRHIVYEGGVLTKEAENFLMELEPDICIFGHTHQARTEWRGRTLLFNPGSAGPKRFSLPRGLGLLVLDENRITPLHVSLADRPE